MMPPRVGAVFADEETATVREELLDLALRIAVLRDALGQPLLLAVVDSGD